MKTAPAASWSGAGTQFLPAATARRYGEIDIIARDGPTIVFVEVKARTDDRYGGGAAAVTLHKQAKMTAVAEDYLARRRLRDVPCRFDVVAIGFDRGRQDAGRGLSERLRRGVFVPVDGLTRKAAEGSAAESLEWRHDDYHEIMISS